MRGVFAPEKNCLRPCVCAVAVAVLLNSLTFFSYENVQYESLWPMTSEERSMILEGDSVFLPVGMEGGFDINAAIQYEVRYSEEFIYEEGNIWPVESLADTYMVCDHDYVSGFYQLHTLNSDGSCKLVLYESIKCSKCADIVKTEVITALYNRECPH